MSLATIMNSANSGLQVAQAQLRVISDNVANVNTVGYVRKTVEQRSTSIEGMGSGVEVAKIRLATDRFLQAASLTASADASRAGVRYELLDSVQSLFGDPTGTSSFFDLADQVFAAFAVTAEDPLSSPRRQEAIVQAKALLNEASRVAGGIQDARLDADNRLTSAVDTVNDLLKGIEDLNVEISRAAVGGGDTSGAESAQAQLIDQLSTYLDIRILPRATGGVTLRTGDGMLLAGQGAATLSYKAAGTVDARTDFSELWITEPHGQKRSMLDHLGSGEIKGLLEFRDVESAQTAERLSEVVSRMVGELNRAHNSNSASPAPNSLTGRNTGLDLPTAIGGFTGRSTIAVTNSAGVIQRRVEVDFSAGTLSVDGGGAVAFTPGNFLSTVNTALGGYGTAGFANGALSLTASAGNGVAIADGTPPSAKAGQNFSTFFGMNDLIRSDRIYNYDTGLRPTDAHGFTAGDTISFRMSSPTGARMRDITVAIPPGGTMNDLVAALNDPASGVGRYGSFALDANGNLAFSGNSQQATLSVIDDQTSRGPGGPSFSELFGVDAGTRAARTTGFTIRADIDRDPKLLALARLDLTAPAGTAALSNGDGRGARALADVGEATVNFAFAGGAAGGAMTISRYMSDLAGDVGGRASAAKTALTSANALATEAQSRRTSHEGVNLDEELVKMTTYQQAFNASARMIQAAKDMYDVLIGMMA
ncbi:MAG TPA: flagellar hook-associated protein FlgK [Caulobacteraceae bacterium]|nr:flagellar hook-associated protein FlgK [Caulobacteraceae bacterium]